jgi:hypothetical protein
MPITPKPVVEMEVITTRFPKELVSDLDAYCKHLGGASDRSYVIVEAVRHAIAKDRGYQRARRSAPVTGGGRATGSDARPANTAGAPPQSATRPPAASDPKQHGTA